MILVALLAAPLLTAALLSRMSGQAAVGVHRAGTGLTLIAAVFTVVQVTGGATPRGLGGLLRIDALSVWMVTLISLVAALSAAEAPRQIALGGARRFYPLFHLFVFTMLLAVTTDDVGVMWVAVEGTTLASVFLVNFDRTRASLEASYKYLLISSVGIALAFVGTVLVYFAYAQQAAHHEPLRWTMLVQLAPGLPARVLEMAFVFLLVGYGTKAGLAPMHTWLPDAHSEAPAPISAMMSGVLLSVGLYAVVRYKTVLDLAVGPAFAQRLLLALALVSLGVAAAFLWTPTNYKRMLAYSSVEHLGVVCLGLGFGGAWGTTGAVLHIANHALAKSTLFLLSGRIRKVYGSANISAVRGLLDRMPITGRAFLVAMLALLGLPPFGLFVSELMIFGAGFQAGFPALTSVALVLLVVAFGGLLRAAHRMLYGAPPAAVPASAERVSWGSTLTIALPLLLLVLTGVAWPTGLAAALDTVAAVVRR